MTKNPNSKIQFRALDSTFTQTHPTLLPQEGEAEQDVFPPWKFTKRWWHNQVEQQHSHVTRAVLNLVAASAAEIELGAMFLNAQEEKMIHLILMELGHPQSPTTMHVDNTTAMGIVDNTIKRQWSSGNNCRIFLMSLTTQDKIIWETIHPKHTLGKSTGM